MTDYPGAQETPQSPSASVMNAVQAPAVLKALAHDVRWRLVLALAQSDLRVQELVSLVREPQNLVSYHLRQLRDAGVVEEHRSTVDARDIYYVLDLPTLQAYVAKAVNAIHPSLLDPDLLAMWATPLKPSDSSESGSSAARATLASLTTFAPPPMPTSPEASEQALISLRRSFAKHGSTSLHATDTGVRVLFLCTHNSVRSQMAEGILRHLAPHIEIFSAGSDPRPVHPLAISTLQATGIDIRQQRAKHVDEFRGQTFAYVITLCDHMREACPSFLASPAQMHWSFPDPAEAPDESGVRQRAFMQTALQLFTRIRYLLPLIQQGRLSVA